MTEGARVFVFMFAVYLSAVAEGGNKGILSLDSLTFDKVSIGLIWMISVRRKLRETTI